MRRRSARELALQVLFAVEHSSMENLNASEIELIAQEFRDQYAQNKSEEIVDYPFFSRLLRAILIDVTSLDQNIESLSEHWKMNRMPKVDRNILRIGTTELTQFADVPPHTAIDECIEMAKKYGSENSPAFVNGILDRVYSSLKDKN